MEFEFTPEQWMAIMVVFVSAIFITWGIVTFCRNDRERVAQAAKKRQEIEAAAKALEKETGEILSKLHAYMQKIESIILIYLEEDEKLFNDKLNKIPFLVPALRNNLDEIELTSAYLGNGKKLLHYYNSSTKSDIKVEYLKAYYLCYNIHIFIGLLTASKFSGFMRTSRLLDEYLSRINRSKARKKAVDTIDAATADYFDETAYDIIQVLKAQLKLHQNNLEQFAELQESLKSIKQQPSPNESLLQKLVKLIRSVLGFKSKQSLKTTKD